MAEKKLEKTEHKCTIRGMLDVIGGKWSMPIIYTLFSGTKRFRELERGIPNINSRTLVKELKNMEANGIVLRKDYDKAHPTVQYTATAKGEKQEPIICALIRWGEEHMV